jgi:translocation and assembly module TamB
LLLVALAALVLLPLALLGILSTGWADGFLRQTVIEQVSNITGGAVEMDEFAFDPWNLQVTMGNLTVHGREPAGTPPFFHADRVQLAVSIDSFWGRRISLGNLELTRPVIHLRFERDGSNNAPAPRPSAQPGTPLRQRLFSFLVRRVRLMEGELIVNDVRVPLVVEGGRLDLSVDYSQSEDGPAYLGDLRWQQIEVAARRYIPFRTDVSARFQFRPDSFRVTQLVWELPHTSIDAQFGVASFARPEWTFRYRGRLDFQDIQAILRKPNTPDGRTDFSGQGSFAAGILALDGRYSAEQIALHFDWFHGAGISSRGSYHADRDFLEVPDFSASALGGAVSGNVRLAFRGLAFRAETRARGVSLAETLAAVDNPKLPVIPLHWDGAVDADSVTTWNADFKNVDSRGMSFWAPPAELQPGRIPATARLDYHYSMATNTLVLGSSEIATPSSRIRMSGTLGRLDSAIETLFETDDLLPWNDFINRIRGEDAEPKVMAGAFRFQGRMTGPLGGPTFSGHVTGSQARYESFYWDQVEGDLTYWPEGFRFERGSATRENSSAQFEIALFFDRWRFLDDSPWNFDATLVRTDTDGLQAVMGWSYPVHGLLSGSFHGGGTRANPEMEGLFDVIDPQAWGWQFDRARGEIGLRRGEVRVANAELRLLPPPAESGAVSSAPGLLTGNFAYQTGEGQISFDLTGAVLPLEGIERIQAPSLPIGGQLSFRLSGEGPARAPRIQGSLRLVDLRVGDDTLGSFQGALQSDGARMTLQVDSEISPGEAHGRAEVLLRDDYPITGHMSLRQIDVDPLITAGLRLRALTGHSSVDGEIALSGFLLRPETLVWDADLSRISVSYAAVTLENSGPVRLQYRRDEIRIEQAVLRGTDTDFRISGLARFSGDRPLDLQIAGTVNLRLFSVLAPALDAVGAARVDAGIAGTFSRPRITGRVRLDDASMRYGDFPTGLSQVAGDLVFDANRLVFDNLTAESGGGRLALSGAVTYGEGPLRYDLTARSQRVRIRYPVGMSWLAGGTLRLIGNAQSGTLSGRVTVERLLMAEGFDLGSLVTNSTEPVSAPSTTSNFLRNLQFDVQADLAPNARFEWPSARFQTEASMRVRGTWEHPILLGHIHLLSGDMDFRGNRYQLSRGDINFANPFRLDPVINIEATTTIRQYEVTVNFSGAASHLTMSYRSDPPLPSSDIIALLAMGQTGEESRLRGLPAVQTPGTGATTLLSEAISSQLGGRIQRLFGISHFSVDPFLASTTGGQETSARITISQQFSRDLIITYVTNVTSNQQQIIQIEYAVRRDVSLIALRDQNGTFGVDIVFKKRFK